MEKVCLHLPLGLVEYDEAFRFQRAAAAARDSGTLPDLLVTLEHPPVITLGRRANPDNILMPEDSLHRERVAVRRSTRGGDVTYHGPGQLVGYPILSLREMRLGAAAYVHGLERVLIDVLEELGLEGRQDSRYVGVWVGDDKVAAIGVAISRGITMHGFALNVDPNLSHFKLINPCGIAERGVSSLARLLGRPVSFETVRLRVVAAFARVFGVEIAHCLPGELERMGISVPGGQVDDRRD